MRLYRGPRNVGPFRARQDARQGRTNVTPMRGVGASCLLACCLATHVSGQEIDSDQLRAFMSLGHHQSYTRRFLVIGTNRLDNMELARWAENTADRVEQVLGAPHPFDDRILRIAVPLSATPGAAIGAQRFRGGRLTQRLTISSIADVQRETVQELFCRLLLNGHVISRYAALRKEQERDKNRGDDIAPRTVPRWLSEGLAQNLYPSRRSRNSDLLLAALQDDQAPPWTDVVRAAEAPISEIEDLYPDITPRVRAAHGLFLTWVLSLPGGEGIVSGVLDALAAGKPVSAEDIADLMGVTRPGVVDARWRDWIDHRRFIVSEPGKTSPTQLEQLRVALLLSPGTCGIPLSSNAVERIAWPDLIARRKERWIPRFAGSKTISLQLVAAGAGQELRQTVNAYAEFLGALTERRSPQQLEELLAQARASTGALDGFGGPPPDTAPDPEEQLRKTGEPQGH